MQENKLVKVKRNAQLTQMIGMRKIWKTNKFHWHFEIVAYKIQIVLQVYST